MYMMSCFWKVFLHLSTWIHCYCLQNTTIKLFSEITFQIHLFLMKWKSHQYTAQNDHIHQKHEESCYNGRFLALIYFCLLDTNLKPEYEEGKRVQDCWKASKKFSRILRRRPRPKLGCGAKERKRRREYKKTWNVTFSNLNTFIWLSEADKKKKKQTNKQTNKYYMIGMQQ
jgi:hypothetical protein